MATVVISPSNVVNFLEGGGHFWVYMQYVSGLRRLGCEVFWLEHFRSRGNPSDDASALSTFRERMERYGFAGRLILYERDAERGGRGTGVTYIGRTRSEAERIFRRADLLLNFNYAVDPALLRLFRRTALVDIDPGLLQFWIRAGQLSVAAHDLYLTTGETVGTPSSPIPNCGLDWLHIRPPVALDLWPVRGAPTCEAFTTVSNWWGGNGTGSGEWIVAADGSFYENTKRISFLGFLDLPRLTSQPLELALCWGPEEAEERPLLERHGWRVRHSREVACTPERYQEYIQQSRGEFSCAKPSCMRLQNAWISDRTLCYLASGRPVVVQDTGPSALLPNGEGMFRFSTPAEAAEALETINASYARQCHAAREIAETHFDADRVLGQVLNAALP